MSVGGDLNLAGAFFLFSNINFVRFTFVLPLLFALFFGKITEAQNAPSDEINCIRQVVEYRSHLLRKNPMAIEELRLLFEIWDSLGVPVAARAEFSGKVVYAKAGSVMPNWAKTKPDSTKTFDELEVEIFGKNAELMGLVNLDLLKGEYPFKIDPATRFFEELRAYKIDSTQRIAEIGCGTGSFGLVLAKIYPKTNIFLTEIEGKFLKYIKSVIDESPEMFGGLEINLVQGTDKMTKLEGKNLDLIIIRNAFHHFSKKKKMLNSIKKSLKPGGRLVVKDPVIEYKMGDYLCNKAMPLAELIRTIEANRFRLVKSTRFDDEVLLEFIVEN